MLPPSKEIVTGAVPLRPWVQWFARLGVAFGANVESGTTANRPTGGLWIGRRYFDTTLGKPVYVKSLGPVVWVDGAGTVS
jgi:hypothetical protein